MPLRPSPSQSPTTGGAPAPPYANTRVVGAPGVAVCGRGVEVAAARRHAPVLQRLHRGPDRLRPTVRPAEPRSQKRRHAHGCEPPNGKLDEAGMNNYTRRGTF